MISYVQIRNVANRICKGIEQGHWNQEKHILTNKPISLEMSKRVLHWYTEPTLLYGCESWILNKCTRHTIEKKFFFKEEWWDFRVQKRKATRKSLGQPKKINIKKIGKNVEHLVITGNIDGKRRRRRRRQRSRKRGREEEINNSCRYTNQAVLNTGCQFLYSKQTILKMPRVLFYNGYTVCV